ncbi:M23 family metallopeptidase [Paludifilum halophilum]|uniref:LysM domain-containing protein n=1 Tax=Paludifilum halophilum TaxID=1642702 RepID=A0A235B6X9_9BACL|nr:M23 family metallopeptidase [Paludifilum halophilum]OYD07991.1 hypothetical protein CHM34_07685 [Paludifilum halophilum]
MPKKKPWVASSLSLATASLFVGNGTETAQAEETVKRTVPDWEKEQIAQDVLYQYLTPISSVSEGNLAVDAEKKPLIHKVKEGDTLYGIGNRYGVDSQTLASYNKIEDPRKLQVGQRVKVPVELNRIRVKEGEGLTSIARRHSVSVSTLKKANPDLKSTNALYVGQVLVVPKPFEPKIEKQPEQSEKKKQRVTLASDSSSDQPSNQSHSFRWPVKGEITSGYGWRNGKMHQGIDISNTKQKQNVIRASLGGEVVRAGYAGGYGNLVVLDHGNGWTTYYAHLSGISVSKGESVSAGGDLGHMGTTGNSTGVHLHFEIRRHDQPINPLSVLP